MDAELPGDSIKLFHAHAGLRALDSVEVHTRDTLLQIREHNLLLPADVLQRDCDGLLEHLGSPVNPTVCPVCVVPHNKVQFSEWNPWPAKLVRAIAHHDTSGEGGFNIRLNRNPACPAVFYSGSPMKIRIYSDLHTEFEAFTPPAMDSNVVILAGDIGVKSSGVKWANETFSCPVVYVCGNHEYYDGHIDGTLEAMKDAAEPHVRVLENESWVWQQTRFLCATAWTDFSSTGSVDIARRRAAERMSDFRMIRAGQNHQRLRPEDLAARNVATHAWLLQELSRPFAGRTVVVTHHAPLIEVLNGPRDHLDAAYANHWPHLVQQADLWVFGHTHCPVDFMEGNCRVVSNPKGYPGESVQFSPDFEVEI